ncbi:1-deoxy-D-xylulose 5-phosphate reductoisomerase [Sphingomonas paucimobilis]|nr:1-deoxy-D-xylulose 5-phosphate reductoisomerase [Sphingomonas paucimobilis]
MDRSRKRLAQFTLSVPLAIMAPGLAAGPGFFALGLIAASFFFLTIISRRPEYGAGALYVGLPVLSLLAIRLHEDGLALSLWAMALVWACDSGAFFVGRQFGGPKLAPTISPAKTWSGLIGGVAAATLLAMAMRWAHGLPLHLVVATPFLAVLAQGGDLFESALKRRAGVKDSGNVLPGHGGVMDRLDGIVPVRAGCRAFDLPAGPVLMRSVTILGATGSVGTSTLDLVEREPDRYYVRALTANCDVAKLAAAARRTNAELAVVADESCLPDLREALAGTETGVAGGRAAVIEAAAMPVDWTMGAIVGCAGLEPAMAAIANGGTVVLANKEPLVSAGEVVLAARGPGGRDAAPGRQRA